jgi:hypothetical protein
MFETFSRLHSLPSPSRRWQPIARTIWRASRLANATIRRESHNTVCMYVFIYVCLYVRILYVSVFEGMYVLPCVGDV